MEKDLGPSASSFPREILVERAAGEEGLATATSQGRGWRIILSPHQLAFCLCAGSQEAQTPQRCVPLIRPPGAESRWEGAEMDL